MEHGGAAPVALLPWEGEDEALLARARRRDEAVGALLYDRFWKDVNRMVWSLLGADAEHEDVVADVFVRLLRGVRRVREASKLRAWVMTVTVNTVRSELRRRTLRRRLQLTDNVEPLASTEANQQTTLTVSRTFAALDRLPAGERLAFALRHIQDRPLQEVADLCSCSLATIKRRLARAEKRFVALARRDPLLLERLRRGSRGDVA